MCNVVGDWIKMRTDLYRDPKVICMAESLMVSDGELNRYVSQNSQRDMTVTRNVMRNAVVGALVTVWGVLRHQGKRDGDSLRLSGCSLSVIDDIADLPGFGQSMLSVGWLVKDAKGLLFPRFFEENNIEPQADAKAKNAERQRRFREARKAESNAKSNELRNVTSNAKSNAREEREKEKSNNSISVTCSEVLIPETMRREDVQKAAAFWFQHLGVMAPEKIPMANSPQMESFWQEAARIGPEKFIRQVEFTTSRGWINLRDPDETKKRTPRNGKKFEGSGSDGTGAVSRQRRNLEEIVDLFDRKTVRAGRVQADS